MKGIDFSLCVIVDRNLEGGFTVEQFTRQVIEGGATWLQVRCKHESTRDVMDVTRSVLSIAREARIPVIVNDRVDVAVAAGADGVHLGEDDMAIPDARRIGGADLVIGATVRDVESAKQACVLGADYLGVGPMFPTRMKPGLLPLARGTLGEIRRGISLPIVAIGGINETNAAVPLEEGADGIAVISALRQCQSPKEVASRLRAAVDKAKKR